MKAAVSESTIGLAVGIGFLLLIEAGLRLLAGAPHGTFAGVTPAASGVYPANTRLEMSWGPIPYALETNSLGLRGRELDKPKRPGVTRIAMLGDSVTDGFFVDDHATYPYALEEILREERSLDVEVANAAAGGGSIDKAIAIYEALLRPLEPDLVVLTFVTNDISDIAGRSRQRLLEFELAPSRRATARNWLVTRTALGETLYDAYLRAASRTYRHSRDNRAQGEDRYRISGARDSQRNLAEFEKRFGPTDGRVLREPLPAETRALVDSYLFALEELVRRCRRDGATPVFVYFPAYPQVHGDAPPSQLQRTLRGAAERLGLAFLDLTPAFREARDQVLHLAPLDYHPSPAGYRLMAEALADFLVERVLPRPAPAASARAATGRPASD